MKIEIKSRFTAAVLFTATVAAGSQCPIRDALIAAVASRANLSGADLSRANLSRANLSHANLSRADLSGVSLSGADLSGVSLYGANLYGANLSGANLYGANLSGADLSGVSLYGANLSRADLSGVSLSGANLSGAGNAKEAKFSGYQIPQEGSLVVFKKLQGGYIAKLLIPPESRRTATPIGRKCRAECVEVLAIMPSADGATPPAKCYDKHTGKMLYEVGATVRPDKYDDSFLVECTHGIHFFLTREEAEAY